ncbi:MAG: hypothetical protein KF723_23100 [Rhizobiaceae bacterium]|nr:hypothetical protein [Rhizobiaceae bacterium]
MWSRLLILTLITGTIIGAGLLWFYELREPDKDGRTFWQQSLEEQARAVLGCWIVGLMIAGVFALASQAKPEPDYDPFSRGR